MNARPEIGPGDPWERFARAPSTIAHPAHIAALFDGAIGEETARELGRHPRFSGRLSAFLDRRLALPQAEPPLDPRDRALALMSAERLTAIAAQAAAVCWAEPLAREVRSERVAALRGAIGDDAYTAALAHRSLALGEPAPDEPEALAALILADADGCLAAWLASQSAGVAARARLRLPPEFAQVAPRESLREAGPTIMRTLAS